MNINVIDIVAAALILLIALISAKKGFLLSLLNLAAVIASAFLSKILSTPLSQYIYTSFCKEPVINKLYEYMPSGSVSGEINESINSVLSQFPESIIAMAEKYNLLPQTLTSSAAETVLTVENIETQYIAPIITGVAAIITMLVLFVVFSIILKLVAGCLNKLIAGDKHKVTKTANMILGGIFGLVKGVIPVAAGCAALNLIAPITENESFISMVNSSYVCSFVANLIK